MSDVITIHQYNETFDKIQCELGIAKELDDYFTFKVPNYWFHPLYKQKVWSGDIHLFSTKASQLYVGLRSYVEKFAADREYEVRYDFDNSTKEFSIKEAKEFVDSLNLPMEVRDYQLKTFVTCVRTNRRLVISPTASGKSLIIYLLYRYYNTKALIIVPTISLVHQLAGDFVDYGYDKDLIHKIYAEQDLETNLPLRISTWQSLYKLDKGYYDDTGFIVVDEAHHATAKSLKDIMEKATNCKYRFGFSGSLDGTQTHKLVLEGLFGQILQYETTASLTEKGHLTPLSIKCILLKHQDVYCKLLRKALYDDEIDYLVSSSDRNRFIRNLAESLEGNTLILFRLVDKHGKVLYDDIKETVKDRPIYFIHGGIEGETRDEIRRIVETMSNAIIIASYGTFSTGINILRLHNIIFASPYKGRIKVLQSIGRGLRKVEGKDVCTLYDIADDLSYKKYRNHTLKHFVERIKIYVKEQFNYKIYKVALNG